MFKRDNPAFPVVTPRHTLARFMAHYELFKMVIGKPGCIVDIGVGMGGSTWAFAAMADTLTSEDRDKQVYGFDTFTGFPSVSPVDGSHKYVKLGGLNLKLPEQRVPSPRVSLITGDIAETVPAFVKAHPGLRIALLNLDADLYAPTKVALECLEPLVVPGGIVILDEYDLAHVFPGERKAVDEYYGRAPHVLRFPWCTNPSGYVIKGH